MSISFTLKMYKNNLEECVNKTKVELIKIRPNFLNFENTVYNS